MRSRDLDRGVSSEGMVGALGAYKALAYLTYAAKHTQDPRRRQLGATNSLRPQNCPYRPVRRRHCRYPSLALTTLTTLDRYGVDQSIVCGVVCHLPCCRCAVLRRTRLSCTLSAPTNSDRSTGTGTAAGEAPTQTAAPTSAPNRHPIHHLIPAAIPSLLPRRADPPCGPVRCALCPVRQPSRNTRPIPMASHNAGP
jgi:hypothetical protein